MTDVHATVERVESSPEFHVFRQAHPRAFLVHVFTTATATPGPLELGYYNEDKITVFKTDPVSAMPPEEIFQESGKLRQLDLDLVNLGLQDILAKAEAVRKEKYARHPGVKTICILQQYEVPLWNLTIVTGTLQMLNLKFDAQTGALVHEELRSLMDMARNE